MPKRVEPWGEWTRRALCATPEYRGLRWFPEEHQCGGDKNHQAVERRRVRMVCRACPVVLQCHQYAESHHVTAGVWAGKNYGHGNDRGLG